MLREELSQLGLVAVKVGQTLSQRPDILPEDVCEALKTLQTSNKPFPNEEAYQVPPRLGVGLGLEFGVGLGLG